MKKIELTENEKNILRALDNETYEVNSNDFRELEHLEFLGLGTGMKGEFDVYFTYELTPQGKAYIFENPKLRNPLVGDETKFFIECASNLCNLWKN